MFVHVSCPFHNWDHQWQENMIILTKLHHSLPWKLPCWQHPIKFRQNNIFHLVISKFNLTVTRLGDIDSLCRSQHDDVIRGKHFPRYWPSVQGIHRSPVNSPHKGQWRGALIFSLICAWIHDWVNNREAGDLRRPHTHYDVTVMK